MTIKEIRQQQEVHGLTETQRGIENGSIWKFEGSAGRYAMECLEVGKCFLPTKPTFDYFGNRLPSRNELKDGTKGTLANSKNFWLNFDEFDEF